MNVRLALAAGVGCAVLATAAAPASAAPLATLELPAAAPAKARVCNAKELPESTAGVRRAAVTATRTGLLTVRSRGAASDWDVAVFSATTRRLVAAAAGPTSDDLAEGFVAAGERLVVQACRFGGQDEAASVVVDNLGLALRSAPAADEKFSILAVDTKTPADKQRLLALGFDDAHGATATTMDVVVGGVAELEKLRRAGFTWTVKLADLEALAVDRVRQDREFAARTKRSALPSGRDAYRHLADYEAEMKKLALENPSLVRTFALKNKSLLGKTIMGVEVATNVNLADGRPAFANMGVHHAREWPSGEHAMEWAHDLLRGYKQGDARIKRIVENTRNIIVPIVNPDGFNLSREAPVDLGNGLAAIDLPESVDNPDVLPITDPTYTSALLLDQTAGAFAYKRRNCRVKDGEVPKPGECEDSANRTLGVDPNRNYGGLWGGPGASLDPGDDTYRGAGPFSEPETQNIQDLVSRNHVTTLITNHTFSNLILRPPGVKSQGLAADEDALKALSDAMAGTNGYQSIPGWQLYDTTGTTEDWSYQATGGYGFTFEIGPDEFHPPYAEMIAEYEGAGQFAGKGNRMAYILAAESTMDAKQHSVLRGSAPDGTTLRLRKDFMSETSPVIQDDTGKTGEVRRFADFIDTTLEVGKSGTFEWHVNPSTRPFLTRERKASGVADTPAVETDISSTAPPVPGLPNRTEFEVKEGQGRQFRASVQSTLAAPTVNDIDMYLLDASGAEIASGATAAGDETIVADNLTPGRYALEVRNFSSISGYTGKLALYGEKPGSVVTTPATTEAYTLTCEKPAGKVLSTRKVEVKRGAALDLGRACTNEDLGSGGGSTGTGRLKFDVAADTRPVKRALKSGVRVRVRCSLSCNATVQLVLAGSTAKRVGLVRKARRTVVATGKVTKLRGRRTVNVRFTSKARKALRGRRGVKFSVVGVAAQVSSPKTKVTKTRSVTLR